MVKHMLFLKWWFFAILVTLGTYIAYHFGVFHEIWMQDFTKLSFVIFGLFAIISVWCGMATWSVSRSIVKKFLPSEVRKRAEYAEDTGWFVSDILFTIGMIGTVCGFIMMLMGGFSSVDVSNPITVQNMLSKLSGGMATALYTTLAGLISGVLLKIQCFNLTHGLDTFRRINAK